MITHGNARRANYYHWFHEVVLRLYGILERLPPDTRFVVPPHRLKFQDEMLDVVRIRRDRLCEFGGEGAVRFENLYFSPPTSHLYLDSPQADRWFREQVFAAYKLKFGAARRRIYITRRTAAYRRIVNETEIEPVLREFDFEVHQLERYSLREQAALFSEAEIVVSPSGAGLTNVVFAPPGLIVVDIFEMTRVNKPFWSLCTALGHSYWYLIGETVPSGVAIAGDIHLPVDKGRRALAAVTSRPLGGPE